MIQSFFNCVKKHYFAFKCQKNKVIQVIWSILMKIAQISLHLLQTCINIVMIYCHLTLMIFVSFEHDKPDDIVHILITFYIALQWKKKMFNLKVILNLKNFKVHLMISTYLVEELSLRMLTKPCMVRALRWKLWRLDENKKNIREDSKLWRMRRLPCLTKSLVMKMCMILC